MSFLGKILIAFALGCYISAIILLLAHAHWISL